ncbi:AFG1-like ATPase, putative [Angomonas deanei]|uniref:AFG1-like ATPase, putative n=1 Tax=Angomonas deanei TaxID=59799 RepID=A0A7G2CVF4_9TRYP|nr:AFG1-like ATPase, putative [Angomonas deanei]
MKKENASTLAIPKKRKKFLVSLPVLKKKMFRRCCFFLKRPSDAYRAGVAAGTIISDDNQVRSLPVFDRLYDDLVKYVNEGKRKPHPKREIELRPPSRQGIIPSFFARRDQEKKINRAIHGVGGEEDAAVYHPLSSVKGLYVWGGVGCGKTMMMDLLYDNAPPEIKKTRIHFHQFMLDVQKTSHAIRFKTKDEMQDINNRKNIVSYNTSDDRRRTPEAEIDLFDELAQRLISNVELLCFDEVAVADVAHAMILKRLFNAFYKIGLVVIFTSNRAPDQLYLNGLNRGGFLPFIELVKKQCEVYHVVSETDHRLAGHQADTYLCPNNHENEERLRKLFLDFCKGMPAQPKTFRVFGRDVIVPRSQGGVCFFEFYEICGEALSTADYEIIAKSYNTVFINGVPQFDYEGSDVKNRFLVLIDTLYEFRCKVVICAAVEPALLQQTKSTAAIDGPKRWDQLTEFERETGKKVLDDHDASFQMERCISRLYEMRTKEYLESPHREEEVNLSTE